MIDGPSAIAFSDGPRLEPESEGEHVGVRADARVLEQVPGAAEVLAALQDRVALGRAAVLQMPGGADAGDAGSHDDDVEMFAHGAGAYQRCVEIVNSVSRNSTLCRLTACDNSQPAPRHPCPTLLAALGRRPRAGHSGHRRAPARGAVAVRDLRRRPGQGRRNLATDLLLLLPVQGSGAADTGGAGHRRSRPQRRRSDGRHGRVRRSRRGVEGHQRPVQTFGSHRAVTLAGADSRPTNPEVRALWSRFMQKWIDHTTSSIQAERDRGAAPETIPAADLATSLNLMNERTMLAAFADERPASRRNNSWTRSRTSGSPASTARPLN